MKRGGRRQERAGQGNTRKNGAGGKRATKGAGFLKGASRALSRGWAAVRDNLSTSDTDALEMLRMQHRHVDKLFAQIERALKQDHRVALPLVSELANALSMHATIEERHFYPTIRTPETEDLVAESFEEHRQMKRALADVVAAARSGNDRLEAMMAVLQEEVTHHAKEEEEAKLFPLVRTLMDEDQREALGQEMVAAMVEFQHAHHPMTPRALRAQTAM
jgi:hemerythrin superfamily protein